ncbi:hypothetical protein OG885_39285 [Streptomyces sp. NBC_00028]
MSLPYRYVDQLGLVPGAVFPVGGDGVPSAGTPPENVSTAAPAIA